jgi:membrane protease YdiL (CAAX protease family)
VRRVFFNPRGLRAGWRLLIFVGIFVALGFASDSVVTHVLHLRQRAFLDPVGMISGEMQGLIQVLVATAVMARIENRRVADYGIPIGSASASRFWEGTLWGFASTAVLVGLIALFGGYHVSGLAIHGRVLLYFLFLWLVAALLIGLAEELQFRAYLLATLADKIGFWPAAVLLSIGFGALHYFLKPHERWEDFAATGLLALFMCLTLRRTGSLAFAIGWHFAFDFANLFLWSGQNAGEYAVGHLLNTSWSGPQWLTGGFLGPEASWMAFPVIALLFGIFSRRHSEEKFPRLSSN